MRLATSKKKTIFIPALLFCSSHEIFTVIVKPLPKIVAENEEADGRRGEVRIFVRKQHERHSTSV